MVNQQTISGNGPLKILITSKVKGTQRKKKAYKYTISSPYVNTVLKIDKFEICIQKYVMEGQRGQNFFADC